MLLQNPNIKPEAKALLDNENSDGYVDGKHKKSYVIHLLDLPVYFRVSHSYTLTHVKVPFGS